MVDYARAPQGSGILSPIYQPDLRFEWDATGTRWVWRNDTLNFKATQNCHWTTRPDPDDASDVGKFRGRWNQVLFPGRTTPVMHPEHRAFLPRYYPVGIPFGDLGGTESGYRWDQKQEPEAPGGSRRWYGYTPMRRFLEGDASGQTAFEYAVNWTMVQLERRPWAHFGNNPYEMYLTSSSDGSNDWGEQINNINDPNYTGPPEADFSIRQTVLDLYPYYDGQYHDWSTWELAHNESAPTYAAAMMGADIGYVVMWLQASALHRHYPIDKTKNNITFSSRAGGWSLIVALRGFLCGFEWCDIDLVPLFWRGKTCREIIEDYALQVIGARAGGWSEGIPVQAKRTRNSTYHPDLEWVKPWVDPVTLTDWGNQAPYSHIWQIGIPVFGLKYLLEMNDYYKNTVGIDPIVSDLTVKKVQRFLDKLLPYIEGLAIFDHSTSDKKDAWDSQSGVWSDDLWGGSTFENDGNDGIGKHFPTREECVRLIEEGERDKSPGAEDWFAPGNHPTGIQHKELYPVLVSDGFTEYPVGGDDLDELPSKPPYWIMRRGPGERTRAQMWESKATAHLCVSAFMWAGLKDQDYAYQLIKSDMPTWSDEFWHDRAKCCYYELVFWSLQNSPDNLYDSARERLAGGAAAKINWLTDNIIVILASAAYVYAPWHVFLSEVPAGSRVATSGNLTNKSTVAGACDADDVTFPSISGDDDITQILLVKSTGTEGTSPLIARFAQSTGLPLTPNGGNIVLTWSNGPDRIFRL